MTVFTGYSMPPLRHIVSTLYRQRLMPMLVIVQVALACAILVNALFLLSQQLAPMLVPDGIAKGQVLLVDQLISRNGQWRAPRIEAGAQALRALPGVRAVTPALGLPILQRSRPKAARWTQGWGSVFRASRRGAP